MNNIDHLTTFDPTDANLQEIYDYYFQKDGGAAEHNVRVATSNRDAFLSICGLETERQDIARRLIE